MRSLFRDTAGAVAIQIAFSIFALLGFVGLAVDLGEAFALNTELQQAADASALAAAAELDGFTGAQTRATAAACGSGGTCTFGPNRQAFASSGGGKIKLTSVTFLSAIDAAEPTLLPPVVAPAGDVTTALDSDALYVRVQAQTSSISGTLASLVTSKSIFTTTAVATAARLTLVCTSVPLAICNPAGDGNDPFSGANAVLPGHQLQIDGPKGGYLCPVGSGNCGGSVLGNFLGGITTSPSCALGNPGLPSNKPGGTVGQVRTIDTRFDPRSTFNITSYPVDSNITTTQWEGNANWGQQAYWTTNHSGVSSTPIQAAGTTRYQMYQWENQTNGANIPAGQKGQGAASTADVRLLDMAIAKNCLDVTGGRATIPADGYAQVFMTQPYGTKGPLYVEFVKALPFSSSSGLVSNHVQLVR